MTSLESSSASISSMLGEADERGSFSQEDFNLLEQDDNFTKWLEENGKTMRDITSATYTE
jgi:hypothetical protein